MMLRALGGGCLLCLLAFAAGCGSSGPRVMKVSGTVTRGGKPVDKLVLNFYPDDGRPSWGVTDAAGHYTLKYDKDRDGAVVGNHKIWVKAKPTSPKEEDDIARGILKASPDLTAILQKYGNEQSSPLVREVKEDNQVIDLPLD